MAFSLVFQERRSDLLQTTKVVKGRQKRMSLVNKWRCGYIFFRCTTLSEAERGLEHLKVLLSSSVIMSINVCRGTCTIKARRLEFHHPSAYARFILLCIFTHPMEVSDLRARDQLLLTDKPSEVAGCEEMAREKRLIQSRTKVITVFLLLKID